MNRVALIDSDSLVFFACHNKKDSNKIKTVDDCKKHLDELIANICKFTHATHYIATITVGKNFRFGINPEYKANRKALVKPLYFDAVKEHLIVKHKAVWDSNLESDDIVNIYKRKIEGSFICACDSDILLGLPYRSFNYKKFEWITTSVEDAHRYFWSSMITGTHNGVKGLKGKGEKYAQTLIESCGSSTNLFSSAILKEYISHYKGENVGIEEFYKNYKCIRLLEDYEGLIIPEPVEVIKEIKNEI